MKAVVLSLVYIIIYSVSSHEIRLLDRQFLPIDPTQIEIIDPALTNENRSTITRGYRSGMSAGIITTAPGVQFKIEGKMSIQVQSIRETIDEMYSRMTEQTVEEREMIKSWSAEASVSAWLKFMGFRGGSKVEQYDKTKSLNMRISDDLHHVITTDQQAWEGFATVQFNLQGVSTGHFTAHHRAYLEVFSVQVDDVTIQVIENAPGVLIGDPGTGNESADVTDNDTIVIVD